MREQRASTLELGAALGAGALFGLGLALSGMTQPSKVIGFLDFFGDWDPSLALVMAGAIGVHFLGRLFGLRRSAPVFGGHFRLPTREDIDPALIGGAALFGVGWGLGGVCPGPALSSLHAREWEILVFVASMFAGVLLFRTADSWLRRYRQQRRIGVHSVVKP